MTARYPRTVLGTVCVPWKDDGSLDEACFRRTIANLVRAGMPDLYIFGTAGEGYAVSEADFRRIAAVFAETMREAGGAPPMVGVINQSLRTILERIDFCRSEGITTFQISLPNWGALSDEGLSRFFAEVCGSFPDCKFLHYNLMRAGRLVRPREYAELAELHPNLVATKHGGADMTQIVGLMAEVPQLRHFLSEQGYYLGAPLGECALLASLVASNPARGHEYLKAGADGDLARFAQLHRELSGVLLALLGAVGMGKMDGAYDKVIHKLAEPDFPLALLPPYEGASEAGYRQYLAELEANFPGWLPAMS
jgi:dihydrodipicolinate synthase/N-acetylneuraminate lyase